MALHGLSIVTLFSRRASQHKLLISLALLNMARVLLLWLRRLLLIPKVVLLNLRVILLLLLVLGLLNLNQQLVVNLKKLTE